MDAGRDERSGSLFSYVDLEARVGNEPVLRSRTASPSSVVHSCFWSYLLTARDQHSYRAGGHPSAFGVGATCMDDRHARAEHDAGGIGASQEDELLRQDISGFQVRHHQDVSPARHFGNDSLLRRRSSPIRLLG